jgi:hypothetical protein
LNEPSGRRQAGDPVLSLEAVKTGRLRTGMDGHQPAFTTGSFLAVHEVADTLWRPGLGLARRRRCQ